jgi:hypothetical protein
MRSPRPATTSLPTDTHGRVHRGPPRRRAPEALAAAARAARPAVTLRGPGGCDTRGPCGRQNLRPKRLRHTRPSRMDHAQPRRRLRWSRDETTWRGARWQTRGPRREGRAERGAVEERAGSGRQERVEVRRPRGVSGRGARGCVPARRVGASRGSPQGARGGPRRATRARDRSLIIAARARAPRVCSGASPRVVARARAPRVVARVRVVARARPCESLLGREPRESLLGREPASRCSSGMTARRSMRA